DLGMGGSKESVQLARYRLGVLLNRNQEFDRAADLLAPEAGPGPLAEKIQFALGMALLHISSLPDEVDPSKKSLVLPAGEIEGLLQESKYDEAFPKLQKLLQQNPSVPFLHLANATAFAALSAAERAVQLGPDSAEARYLLGRSYLEVGQTERALQELEAASKMAPGS